MQIGVTAMVNMLSQANQWVGLLINQYTRISARIGKSYKKLNKCLTVFIERVIFWNAKGYGWSIGSIAFLVSGTHWHKSGLDSDEPWNGKWEKNVTVDCKDLTHATHTAQPHPHNRNGKKILWKLSTLLPSFRCKHKQSQNLGQEFQNL